MVRYLSRAVLICQALDLSGFHKIFLGCSGFCSLIYRLCQLLLADSLVVQDLGPNTLFGNAAHLRPSCFDIFCTFAPL